MRRLKAVGVYPAADPERKEQFLGRSVFLPGHRHAMDDSHSDQAQNAHPDPLQRYVEQVGTNRHASDEYDVSNEIYSKRHETSPEEQTTSLYPSRTVRSVRKHTYVQVFKASEGGVQRGVRRLDFEGPRRMAATLSGAQGREALALLERTDAAKRPVRLLGVGVGVHGLCGVDAARATPESLPPQ